MPPVVAAIGAMTTAELLASAAAVATVAGTAVSAAASASAGQQQKKAADYQAKQLEQQALQARQQAAIQVAAQDQRSTAILSSIRSSAAASGIEISSGSPLEVYQSSSQQAQLNDMYTKYAGNLQASGLQSQAALTAWGGRNAQTAGYLTAAGDVIGGAGSLAKFGLSRYDKLGSNNPPAIS